MIRLVEETYQLRPDGWPGQDVEYWVVRYEELDIRWPEVLGDVDEGDGQFR